MQKLLLENGYIPRVRIGVHLLARGVHSIGVLQGGVLPPVAQNQPGGYRLLMGSGHCLDINVNYMYNYNIEEEGVLCKAKTPSRKLSLSKLNRETMSMPGSATRTGRWPRSLIDKTNI